MTKNIKIWIILLLSVFAITGCSSRIETQQINEDSTVIYPAIATSGINAKITFYRKINNKTGKKVGLGTSFKIKDKRNLRALINIENRAVNSEHKLVFHIDWINEAGVSFHRKQVDLLTTDSSNIITSSISISPLIRVSGNYTLRLYLHRELIAEKKFVLLPEEIITPPNW